MPRSAPLDDFGAAEAFRKGLLYGGKTFPRGNGRGKFPEGGHGFPPAFVQGRLDGAPVFLPTRSTSLRRPLDQFFDLHNLHPRILGEFEDSALLQTFGAAGRAMFPVSALVEEDACRQHGLKTVGHVEGVRERFYAISPERKLKHPAVIAICESAKKELFV